MTIRLLILLLLAILLFEGFKAGEVPRPLASISAPVLIYLALAVASVIRSSYPHQSLQWLMVLLSYAVLLYALVSFIRTWNHVIQLLGVVLAVSLMEAVWALAQSGWSAVNRPAGTFFNPNFLAGYLVAGWAVILGWLCHHPVLLHPSGNRPGWLLGEAFSGRRREVLHLSAAGGLLGVFLAAILLTGSRGGMLACFASAMFVLAVRFRRRGIALWLLAVGLIIVLVPNPLRERLQAEHVANPVTYARVQIWHSSLSVIVDHPLGAGLGLYQYVYPRYAVPVENQIARFGKVAHSAHSEYLQMAAELGAVSLLVFGWGMVVVGKETVRVLRGELTWWQRGSLVGLAAGVIGALVQAGVDSNFHEPALAIVLTLAVAILLSARHLAEGTDRHGRTVAVRSRVLWAGLGFLVIAGAAVLVLRMGLAWMAYEDGARAFAQGRTEEAVEAYHMAMNFDPGVALYHSGLAAAHFRTFEQTGNIVAGKEAARAIRTAMALNSIDGRLPGLLGYVYASLALAVPSSGLPEEQASAWRREAVAAYQQALTLDPYQPFNLAELGRLYFALGEPDKARAIVESAVALEPNFLPGREWLARYYLQSGQRAAADQEYREIQERQQRYAHWAKDAVEERYLKADVTALAAALKQVRPPT